MAAGSRADTTAIAMQDGFWSELFDMASSHIVRDGPETVECTSSQAVLSSETKISGALESCHALGSTWLVLLAAFRGRFAYGDRARAQLLSITRAALARGVAIGRGTGEMVLMDTARAQEALGQERLVVRDVKRFARALACLLSERAEVLTAVQDAAAVVDAYGRAEWQGRAPPVLARDGGGLQRYALVRGFLATAAVADRAAAARVIQRAARARPVRGEGGWPAPGVLRQPDVHVRTQALRTMASEWSETECVWRSLRVRGGGGRPLGLRTQRSPPPVSAHATYSVEPAMSASRWEGARGTWRVRRRDEAPAVVDASRVFDGGGAVSPAVWDDGEPAWLRAAGEGVWSPEWQRPSQPAPQRRTRRQLLASLEEAASADAKRAVETAEAATVQSCRV